MNNKFTYWIGIAMLVLMGSCAVKTNKEEPKENEIASIGPLMDEKIKEITDRIKEPSIPDNIIDVIEFAGTEPNEEGTGDFRDIVNKALNKLESEGGGTLLFRHPQGRNNWIKQTHIYSFSGPIEVGNNTRIAIEPQLKLIFRFGPEEYNNNGKGVITRYEGTTMYTHAPCIRAFNKKNVAIVATSVQ